MTGELGVMLTCSGFLLAVLWMDLIFDVQVRAARDGPNYVLWHSRRIVQLVRDAMRPVLLHRDLARPPGQPHLHR